MKLCLWRIFSLLILCAVPALGQEFTGHVTDPTGAAIPKAVITVHNTLTNVEETTQTTSSGDFRVPFLKVGEYKVTASAPGFKTAIHAGLVLQTDQTATVNFALKIGEVADSITVTSDAIIDFDKADAGEVIENARVTELPIGSRDPGMLSELSAGATWNQSLTWDRPFDDTQNNLAINGGQNGGSELLLDGIANSAASANGFGTSRIAYVPLIDSTQEVKVITNPYDAKYGLMVGGVEEVTLKSGTNKLHGDVYEYAERTWLNANSYSNDYANSRKAPGSKLTPTSPLKKDQYGFELDGPVVIPKFYNGKDKTFFMMQYERWVGLSPNYSFASVPDPKWATGDFTSLLTLPSQPITLYDPMSISASGVRLPFGPTDTINPTSAPNIIPASRLNPFAQKVLSANYFPAPNQNMTGAANPFQNNFAYNSSDNDHYRNAVVKVDHLFTQNDHSSLRYGYWQRFETRDTTGLLGAADQGALPYTLRSHTFDFNHVHTFTPNLLADFHANVVDRFNFWHGGPGFNPTTLGWDPVMIKAMGPQAGIEFPALNLNSFASPGQNNYNADTHLSLYIDPTITWIKNKHTFNIGMDARFMQDDSNPTNGGASFNFDKTWTQTLCASCSGGAGDAVSGNEIASLLLGNATNGSDTISPNYFFSEHYWAFYAQDDWKITRKLTLNLGLRWDFLPSEVERHNQISSFDPNISSALNSLGVTAPGYSTLVGGVTYTGVNGVPRAPYMLDKGNLQPRFGLAYALDDKTVVRAGFGESVKMVNTNFQAEGFQSTTQYVGSNNNYANGWLPNTTNTIDHPFTAASIIQPTGSKLGTLENVGQGPSFFNPNYKNPTFWNYTAGVERQFLKHDKIIINYAGSQLFNGNYDDNINRQQLTRTGNPLKPGLQDCNPQIPGGDPSYCSNYNVTNPFKGVGAFNGSGYYSSTTINGLNLTRPMPQFGDVWVRQLNGTRTWYNALQVTAMHKWSDSLTLHGTWTWSKMMDAGGYKDDNYRIQNRNIDGQDRTHIVTISGVYLLPVGRGRTFLPKANRIVDGAIGGWELSSLFIRESGQPWGEPGNFLNRGKVKPYIEKSTGFLRMAAPCVNKWVQGATPGNWTAQSQDALYAPYYSGVCLQDDFQINPSNGANINTVYSGIRNPSSIQFDASMAKNFAIIEGLKLQVRVDFFNVLNHPVWSSGANNNLNDQNFGVIQKGPWNPSNNPRYGQLSAKMVW